MRLKRERKQRSDWSHNEEEGGSDAIVENKELLQGLSQHVVERACFISSQRKFTVERGCVAQRLKR